MTWTEARRTLRYLFRPLSTHVHILLVSCLLVALGLGTLQNGSPSQSRQQAEQTPGTTQLSTSPLSGQQTGSSNTDVPGPKNGSSDPYKDQDKSQQDVYAPTSPTGPLTSTNAAPDSSGTAPATGCGASACTSSPTPTPSTQPPSSTGCSACALPTTHYRHHRCPLSCQTAVPDQNQ
jgi:hypothetical protein